MLKVSPEFDARNALVWSGVAKYCIAIILILIVNVLSVKYIFPYSGDYYNYLINHSGFGGERFEVGYRFLVFLSNSINSNPTENDFLLFLFLTGFTTFSLKAYVVYKLRHQNIFYFLFLYCIYFFLLHEANQVRVSIGISFGVLSFCYLAKNRLFKAFLVVSFACLFHSSIILFFGPVILYFLFDRLKAVYLLAFLFFVGIWFIFDPVLLVGINPLMEKYSEANLAYRFNSVYLLILSLIVVFGFNVLKNERRIVALLYHTYTLIFLFAIALSKIPIVAVRVMDIANIFAFYFVISLKFNTKVKTVFLFALLFFIAFPRFVVFITTDTIYNFPF